MKLSQTTTNFFFFAHRFVLALPQPYGLFCLASLQKQGNTGSVGAVRLGNLNMTEKMSSNPGLTCAVRWKSCSDCKAAWVSIRLLHCLSVTRDKLPNTVRAPVYQLHYNNTVESDYGWQLGTGEHVLRRTAVAFNSILPFICLEISRGRPTVAFHGGYTWQEVWRIKKLLQALCIFFKAMERGGNSWQLITIKAMSLLHLTPDLSLALGRLRPVTPSRQRDTNERIGTTKHHTKGSWMPSAQQSHLSSLRSFTLWNHQLCKCVSC